MFHPIIKLLGTDIKLFVPLREKYAEHKDAITEQYNILAKKS